MRSPLVTIGIDVGGGRKGFHAVALRDGAYCGKFASLRAADAGEWCVRMDAAFIAVDAPCRWSEDGRARPAERQLMAEKIWCFSTPTREKALSHHLNHFGWMLNGEELFAILERTHPLLSGEPLARACLETFPQAIASVLAGEVVSAKRKGTVRRELLVRAGIDVSALGNIDFVDAAMCALAAHSLSGGKYKSYGKSKTGLIVVPWSA